MIQDSTDAAVIALEREHPGWQVWIVRSWDGSRSDVRWCAKRHSDGHLLHAGSAEHLAERIADADAEGQA